MHAFLLALVYYKLSLLLLPVSRCNLRCFICEAKLRLMKANLTIQSLVTIYRVIIPELQWRETTLSDAPKTLETGG